MAHMIQILLKPLLFGILFILLTTLFSPLAHATLHPDITINASDSPVSLAQGDALTIGISLTASAADDPPMDFWLVTYSALDATWQSLTITPEGLNWQPGIQRLMASPPFTFTDLTLPTPILPAGETYIIFAIDDNADNIPDATYLDMAVLTITPYDEPATADVTFRKETCKLSKDDIASLLVSTEDQILNGEFRFQAQPLELKSVTPGTVVLLEDLDIVKITSAAFDPQTNEYILQTEPAALTDLIQDGTLTWKESLATQARYLTRGKRGLSFDPLKQSVSYNGTVNGFQVDLSMSRATGATSFAFKATLPGSKSAPVFSGSMSGQLKDFKTRGNIRIENGVVVFREYIVEDVELDMDIAFGGQEALSYNKKVGIPAEIKIPVYVYGIPLWIGIGGSLDFQAQASLDTSVIFKAKVAVVGDYGLREDQSGYTLLSGNKNKVSLTPLENDAVTMAGKIDMGVVFEFPKITLGLGTSLLGASVYATTKIEILSRYTQEWTSVGSMPIPCDPEYSGELSAEFAVGAGASLLQVITLSEEKQIFYYGEPLWKIEGGCQ